MKTLQVFGVIWPAKRRERPQRGRKPSVKDVFVLQKIDAVRNLIDYMNLELDYLEDSNKDFVSQEQFL